MAATARGIRYPVLTDTANVPRDIGYAAADTEAWLAHTRSYAATVVVDNVANSTTLATIVIPAQTLASRVLIRYGGMIGYGSGASYAATVNASAGTLFNTMPAAMVALAAGAWGAFTYESHLTLAAATATTLTLVSYSSAGNCYFRGLFTAEIKYAGEFA